MSFKLDLDELRYNPNHARSGARNGNRGQDPTDPKVHDRWMDRRLTARTKNEPPKANPAWLGPGEDATDPITKQKKISKAGTPHVLTDDAQAEIDKHVYEVNCTVRLRRDALKKIEAAQAALRQAEADFKQINKVYDRQLRALANLGMYPPKAYEDLGLDTRQHLRLYRK